MRKCVCLYSGGLDSRLVIAVMKKLGVGVIAYHGLHCFEGKEEFAAVREKTERECLALGADKVVFRDLTPSITSLLHHNRYGFGKNLNPCLDCRINTVASGFAVMKEEGADFVCSGEVLGQRPKSQQRDGMNAVNKSVEAMDCAGLLLRPLCAKLLEPTIPETQGWVKREDLYDFSGRGRGCQFELARELKIGDFPAPAGGCLLTDVNFALRMRDLLEHDKNIANQQIDLLKFGRHYRLPTGAKVVSARNSEDGDRIETLAGGGLFFITAQHPGALVLLQGAEDAESRKLAAGIAIYYSKFREQGRAAVKFWQVGGGNEETAASAEFAAIPEDSFNCYRLG